LAKMVFLKELKTRLRELSVIDDTLEALDVPKEYRMLRNWIIRIIIGWIATLFTNLTLTILHKHLVFKMFPPLTEILIIFLPSNTEHVIIISALVCGTILGYTKSRFHRVNERLQVFYFDLFENNYNYRRQNRFILIRQRIARAKCHKQYVWILM
ncbi:hypothetical protein ALC62_03892, partial [Cyphomyrmex costatus]